MSTKNSDTVRTAIDITIKVGVLLLLLVWCFQIILPFISIVFWALIIAVTLFPLFKIFSNKMNGQKRPAAVIITLLCLSIIIVPGIIFTDSLVQGVQAYSKEMEKEDIEVPPPDTEVAEWPVIGSTVYNLWKQAAENPEHLVKSYSSQLKAAGSWLLSALMGTGMAFVQFILSIIISGVFLAYSEEGGNVLKKLFRKLVEGRGDEYANVAELTVRNVSKSVIGVALIQSFLAGIVFLLAGIPYAGLWALICLILCIIQLGPGLVIIPAIIYLFTVSDTWVAVIWTIIFLAVMLSDNILKPILMGKGSPVPTLVVFLGSIGGFIASGFMGLFLGAIVLSLGYKLFLAWVDEADKGMEVEEVN